MGSISDFTWTFKEFIDQTERQSYTEQYHLGISSSATHHWSWCDRIYRALQARVHKRYRSMFLLIPYTRNSALLSWKCSI